MATIKELREQIQSVNALGRVNLSNAGIDLPETATTYDIMQNVGLPDWDDDSPIIATDHKEGDLRWWTLTEKGSMRWYTKGQQSVGHGNNTVLTSFPAEYQNICSKVRQVYVPDSATGVFLGALINCERIRLPVGLTNIKLHEFFSLKEIECEDFCGTGNFELYRCANLSKIELNTARTSLSYGFNQDGVSLEEINLENITSFGKYAFQNCVNLRKDIVFNPNLTELKDSCFKSSGIKSVRFQNTDTLPTIHNTSFAGCNYLLNIYCPWEEGTVANAPWGATNATIHYNTTYDENGNPITE